MVEDIDSKRESVTLSESRESGFYSCSLSSNFFDISYVTVSEDKLKAKVENPRHRDITLYFSSNDIRYNTSFAYSRVDPLERLRHLPDSENKLRDFVLKKLQETS